MNVLNTLLEITIYSTVITLAILLFRKLFAKRISPVLQYAVWTLLLVRLMLPVTLDSGFHFIILPQEQAMVQPAEEITADKDLVNSGIASTDLTNTMQAQNTQPQPGQTTTPGYHADAASPVAQKAAAHFDWAILVTCIWLSGIAGSLAYSATRTVQMNRSLRRNRIATPQWMAEMAEGCRKEAGIKCSIPVIVQQTIDSPALTASLRPRILIPAYMADPAYRTKLHYALMHEFTHYKRRDHLVCLLQTLLRAAYWFNPFVHLAFDRMRQDMETACDSAVLKKLDKSGQKGYLMTVLDLFASVKRPSPMLGMAMNHSKNVAKKRIQGMFMKKKTGRGTQAAAVLLACMLALVCFTTACQPTPEKPVVIGKNDGQLEQKINQSAAPGQKYEAQDNVKNTFVCKDEKVQVNVDAKVTVPDAAQYPVIEVAPDEVPMDFVKTALQVLMEGKTVYEPRMTQSREEIQKEILELQQALADPEHSQSDGLTSGDPETIAETKALFQNRIKFLQQEYDKAPAVYVRKEAKLEWEPSKEYQDPVYFQEDMASWTKDNDDQAKQLIARFENEQMLVLDADLSGGFYGRLTAANYSAAGERWNWIEFYKGRTLNQNFAPDVRRKPGDKLELKITQDEAAARAAGLLDKLGIKGMTLTNIISPDAGIKGSPAAGGKAASMAAGSGYLLTFQRVFAGVPTVDEWNTSIYLKKRYGPMYSNELITVTVNDDGIIGFRWQNPAKEGKTENENVELMPFDSVMQTFQTQMALKYNCSSLSMYPAENENYEKIVASIKGFKVNITDIRLGMVRMEIQDRPGQYRMVPAWKFSGTHTVDQDPGTTLDMKVYPNATTAPYLILNALDGSMIETGNGIGMVVSGD